MHYYFLITDLECGQTIVSSQSVRNGTLTSPLYPADYPSHSAVCRILFISSHQVSPLEQVQLSFVDFHLHYPIGDPNDPDPE